MIPSVMQNTYCISVCFTVVRYTGVLLSDLVKGVVEPYRCVVNSWLE